MDLAHFWNTSGAYEIKQSLRFDGSAYLNRTPASAGNRRTSTFSCWFKWVSTGGEGVFLWASGRTKLAIDGGGSDEVSLDDYDGSYNIRKITSQSLRDPSAWYHLMVVMDTTNATAEDRQRLYLNGQRITAFSTSTNPSQNFDTEWNNNVEHRIGADNNPFYFRGYMAECYMVDGTALTPSSFGETDTITGAWIPKKYSGSYGTNGFYLKFDPSATNGIGHDHSGNGNNFTATGFSTSGTGTDVMSDTPTNNWCTLNPIYKPATSSIAPRNGNLEIVADSTGYDQVRIGTHAFSSGKWYWEYRMEGTNNYGAAGIIDPTTTAFHDMMRSSTPSIPLTGGFKREQNGTVSSAGISNVSSGSISNGTVAMFAVDYNTGKVWVGTAGSWYNSGDPAAGTNPTITIQTLTTAVPFFSPTDTGSQTYYINWGQRAFEYTPPTGYKALNTANLPEPTIKKGSKYFDTKIYTGNGSTQTLTGLGFSPDLVWIKDRNQGYNHYLVDQVRGFNGSNARVLQSNLTSSEQSGAGIGEAFTAFTSDGFSVAEVGGWYGTNQNTVPYVAWAWDANGAGSSNTAGTITSTVSANATAGFSIVSFNSGSSGSKTVGHGLGVAPKLIITKDRDNATNWTTYHASATTATDQYLNLNGTSAVQSASNIWGTTLPTSSVFGFGSGTASAPNANVIAYCFSEVAGYSKFGSYTGNGSSDGPFVFCGFRPRWILLKSTSSGSWELYDTARDTYNQSEKTLEPNSSAVEGSGYPIDVLSNGFKVRTSNSQINFSSYSYIFAAFSETAFKFANAR